jgi:hypothetical protein
LSFRDTLIKCILRNLYFVHVRTYMKPATAGAWTAKKRNVPKKSLLEDLVILSPLCKKLIISMQI